MTERQHDEDRSTRARTVDVPQAPALARDSCFFLDIDGTLLDFAERPDAVRVDAEIKALLRRLLVAADGAVALISGRSVADIDWLFAPPRFAAAGQHGIERRDSRGNLHVHTLSAAHLHAAAAKLERQVAQYPELVLERKSSSLALHYRLAPQHASRAKNMMRDLLTELGDGFELQPGKMLIEIKPSGKDKGTAIAEFLEERPFCGRTPIFIGDDLTDEYGFTLVNSRRGHSVKVGGGVSAAHWRLPDAQAVRQWLAALADQS